MKAFADDKVNVTEKVKFALGKVKSILGQAGNVKILDSSKLKEFANNNFTLDENGRKLSKRVENTMGKGEIARYEQFLLLPQCFQKTCTADT